MMANAAVVRCADAGRVSPLLVNARALGTVAPEWSVVRVSAVRLKSGTPVSGIKNAVLTCTALNRVSNVQNSQEDNAGRARCALKGKTANQSMTRLD